MQSKIRVLIVYPSGPVNRDKAAALREVLCDYEIYGMECTTEDLDDDLRIQGAVINNLLTVEPCAIVCINISKSAGNFIGKRAKLPNITVNIDDAANAIGCAVAAVVGKVWEIIVAKLHQDEMVRAS